MANKRQRKKNAKNNQNKPSIRGLKQSEIDEFKRLRKNVQSKLRRIHHVFGNEIVTMVRERDKKGNILKNGKAYYDIVEPEFFIKTPKLNEIKTKKELKEWMEKAKKFTDRGYERFQFIKNEDGLVISKQVNERAKKNADIAIEAAQKLIEAKKELPIERGRMTLGERLEMQKDDDIGGIRVPKPFDFDSIGTKRRLLERLENLEKRRGKAEYFKWRNEVYKDNFMFVLKQAFHSSANDVLEMLDKMDSGDFFDMSLRYSEMSIDNYYRAHGQVVGEDEDLEKVRSYLQAYRNGEEDFSLRNFPNG
jgi:hypothetical protein